MAIDKLAGTNKWGRNEREVKLGNERIIRNS
jgi:hypothetical protein